MAEEEAAAAKKMRAMELKRDADELMESDDYNGAAEAYHIAYGLWPECPAKLQELETDARNRAEAKKLKAQAEVEVGVAAAEVEDSVAARVGARRQDRAQDGAAHATNLSRIPLEKGGQSMP